MGIGRAFDSVMDWAAFLAEALDNEEYEKIRAGERTGRPLGSSAFVQKREDHLKRPLVR